MYMKNYLDSFVDRSERTHNKLPKETNNHLARSCFRMLVLEAHEQAVSEGITNEVFRSNIKLAIEDLSMPIFSVPGYNSELPSKRQPSILESIDATIDRLEVVNEFENIFEDAASTMIYGGSMKYGPFFNVRHGNDPSDIDAIIVAKKKNLGELNWLGVMEAGLFENQDKVTFMARTALQSQMIKDGAIDIMSQRFEIKNSGYTMSTHIVPEDFLEDMYPHVMNQADDLDRHKYVRDFKERPFERVHVSNYNMSRGLHEIPVSSNPTLGGYVALNPAYSIISGRYIPGMYQNLVIPDPKFAFGENSDAGHHFRNFAAFVAEREELEREIDPESSLLNTDPRKPIFAADVEEIINS